MKTITGLLIACSLALAGTVIAQNPPEAQESPAKKGAKTEKATPGPETKGKKAPPEGKAKGTGAETKMTPQAGMTPPPRGPGKHDMLGGRGEKTSPAATSPQPGAPKGGKTATATPTGKAVEAGKKGKKASATPATGAAASATPATRATSPAATATPAAAMTPATGATASASPAGTGAGATQGTVGRGGKKVETQQVQQIKQQHASFKAQPKPNVAPTVTFNANYRIEGSQSWQGPQYEVFRSYHPEWHDQGWYRSRYTRVELIAGGWYFWNSGYWYPAWGYDPGAAYYAYDGPIYVGHRAEPPDRVIADAQAELKEMGYYTGEVDGLLGPLTRQALREFQADHGLAVTEAIDEPTLEALQLS